MNLGRGFFIGVHSKEEEYETVKEFFELFKVPYEVFEEDRPYSVVLTTQDIPMEVDTHLLILFSSRRLDIDNELGLRSSSVRQGGVLKSDNADLPIYGRLRTFSREHIPLLKMRDDSEVAAVRVERGQLDIIRIGYDLFDEVRFLLSTGQPALHAITPSLDLHISQFRKWILDAGVPLAEVPPTPEGFDFTVCLTHDVDFAGIRNHFFDHTILGFLYRASLGSLFRFLKGQSPSQNLLANWKAVCLLPAVYLGLINDYWNQFKRYSSIESGLASTFFFIPFKAKPGKNDKGVAPKRRASKYDVSEIKPHLLYLKSKGCEIGLHGIDAWRSGVEAWLERDMVLKASGERVHGVRMHWLYFSKKTPKILEDSGFLYDASFGYNDALGYLGGTSQVFRPLSAQRLLELPLHIQDTALFYDSRMNLGEDEAFRLCKRIVLNAHERGGVVVINWHNRSLGPERLWEKFYSRLLDEIKVHNVWFSTGCEAVEWFQKRRCLSFERIKGEKSAARIKFSHDSSAALPDLALKIHWAQPDGSLTSRSYSLDRHHLDLPTTFEQATLGSTAGS